MHTDDSRGEQITLRGIFAPAGVFALEFARAAAWKSITLFPIVLIALGFVAWRYVWPAQGTIFTLLLSAGVFGLIGASALWLLVPASAAQAVARLAVRFGLAGQLINRTIALVTAVRPQLADTLFSRDAAPEDLAALRDALVRAGDECAGGGRGLRARVLGWVMRKLVAAVRAHLDAALAAPGDAGKRSLPALAGALADRAVAASLRDLQLRLTLVWVVIAGAAIGGLATSGSLAS